jgi:hypothetical protein
MDDDNPYADWSDPEDSASGTRVPARPSGARAARPGGASSRGGGGRGGGGGGGGASPEELSEDGFVKDEDGGSSDDSGIDAQINELYTQHREQQSQRSGRGHRPETASRMRPGSGISRSGDLDDAEDEEALRREEERRMQERERERVLQVRGTHPIPLFVFFFF